MSNVFKNIHNLPIDKAVEILDKNISCHVQVVYIQNSFSKHISSIVILVLQKKNKDDNTHKSEILKRYDRRTITLVECQN